MLEIFKKWYRRYLFEEESVLLLVLLTIAVGGYLYLRWRKWL